MQRAASFAVAVCELLFVATSQGLFDGVTSAVTPPAVVLWRQYPHNYPGNFASHLLIGVGDVFRSLTGYATDAYLSYANEAPTRNCSHLFSDLKFVAQETRTKLTALAADPAFAELASASHNLPSLEHELEHGVWPRIASALSWHSSFCARSLDASAAVSGLLLLRLELEARNLLLFVSSKLATSSVTPASSSNVRLLRVRIDAPLQLRRGDVLIDLLRKEGRDRLVEIGARDLVTALVVLAALPNLTYLAIDPWYDKTLDEVADLKALLQPFTNTVVIQDTGEGALQWLTSMNADCFNAIFVDANLGPGHNFCDSILGLWLDSQLTCPSALIAGHDYHLVANCVHQHGKGRDISLGHDWTWWFYK